MARRIFVPDDAKLANSLRHLGKAQAFMLFKQLKTTPRQGDQISAVVFPLDRNTTLRCSIEWCDDKTIFIRRVEILTKEELDH